MRVGGQLRDAKGVTAMGREAVTGSMLMKKRELLDMSCRENRTSPRGAGFFAFENGFILGKHSSAPAGYSCVPGL